MSKHDVIFTLQLAVISVLIVLILVAWIAPDLTLEGVRQ